MVLREFYADFFNEVKELYDCAGGVNNVQNILEGMEESSLSNPSSKVAWIVLSEFLIKENNTKNHTRLFGIGDLHVKELVNECMEYKIYL